jgi:hypothetical protein
MGYGFFLPLGRCLLWLLRRSRSSTDDLLSKLLRIEFDIRDSSFQGFVFVLAYVRSHLNCFTVGKWVSCREDIARAPLA